ncbi:hypothetical protein BH11PSE7_BH11PSE7_03720 [soil metagenome]
MQVNSLLRIAQNSSAVREAITAQGEASAAQEENLIKDLALLTTAIAAATGHELQEPDSEGRMAIDVLVNLAAVPGPAGALARMSLYQAYEGLSLSGNQAGCHALHNAALHMCEQTIFKADENLSMTVAFLGGRAGAPPWGLNGPGKTDIFQSYIIRKLPAALEGEVDILDPSRRLTDTEMQAALAQFNNLDVQPEPLPVPGSAPDPQQHLEQWLNTAAQNARLSDKPVICVVNRRTRSGPGQVAALAARKAGHVQWQVLTPLAGNSGGPELAQAVKDSLDAASSGDAPAVMHMLPPSADADSGVRILMALHAVNESPDPPEGQEAVINHHIDRTSQATQEGQQAAALLTRARVLEATQACSQIGAPEPAVSAMLVHLGFDAQVPQRAPYPPDTVALATPLHSATAKAAASTPDLAPAPASFKDLGATLGLVVSPVSGSLEFRSMFEKVGLKRRETSRMKATKNEDEMRNARTRIRALALNRAGEKLMSEIDKYEEKLPLTPLAPLADPTAAAALQTINSPNFADDLLRSPQVFLDECYKLAANMKNDASAGQQATKEALQAAAKSYLAAREETVKAVELAINALPDGTQKRVLTRLSIDGLAGALYRSVDEFANQVNTNPEVAATYLKALPAVSEARWLKS